MASAPFWIAMICQIVIVIGYFWFYRKEQLGKSCCVVRWLRAILTCLSQRDHDHDNIWTTELVLELYPRTIHYLFGHSL